ncbi:MAG TPA: CHASE3 domain-containing protein, partial [Pontibacter sp.]
VKHTHLVLEGSKELLSNLKDAETGQRGYIITADEAFLEPFYMALERNDQLFKTLQKLTADNQAQQQRLAEAEKLIREKLAFTHRVINVRRHEGERAAVSLVSTAEGKNVMDQIREIFRQVEAAEERLLTIREQEAARSEKITQVLLPVGMLASIMILLLVYYVLHRQIRLRARREAELQESHDWFSKTLFSIGDAVIATNTNFAITFMNPAAEKLTGWDEASALGKPVDMVYHTVHAITRQKVESPVTIAIAKRRTISPGLLPVLLRKDKKELYVDNSGSPIINSAGEVIGSVLIFRDVTQQKLLSDKLSSQNAELEQQVILKTNELIRNEHRLKLTLDNMLEGAAILGFDWRFQYVNNTAVGQFRRRDKEELLGTSLLEQLPGAENADLIRKLRRCMKERVANHFEYPVTFTDGTENWYRLVVQPVPEGLFVLSIDINERRKAEQEKKNYTKGLEEMLFITSHKVRQPVSQILGIAYMLENPVASQEELLKVTGYMKSSVQLLDDVTRELTSYIFDLKQKNEQ